MSRTPRGPGDPDLKFPLSVHERPRNDTQEEITFNPTLTYQRGSRGPNRPHPDTSRPVREDCGERRETYVLRRDPGRRPRPPAAALRLKTSAGRRGTPLGPR